MRLVLVDNLVMPEEGSLDFLDVHPHLGLLALAAVAELDGHQVEIIDPKRLIKCGRLAYDEALYESAALEILKRSPWSVGFTTLGCSFLFALNVAARIKEREPDLPILLGGPHATMLHRQILERFPQFDVIVRYEADEILPNILNNLETRDLAGVAGLSWRSSKRQLHFNAGAPKVEDLDRLPITDYGHYPVRDLELDLLRIEAGRGCPFLCTFCSTASFFQRSFRLKSAERLVKELDLLHDLYGFVDFKLDHDLFTVNKRKILEFCEAVKDRNYRWRASARVDCVDNYLLSKMAEAGCVALYFGIETGSARIQQISRKRLDLDLVEPTLLVCEQLGIDTTASFITGYPEETENDLRDTLDLLGRCFSSSCLTQLHMLAPEPGTPMFDQLSENLEYDGYAGPYNTFLVDANDERLVIDHPDIFSTYHYYPAALPRYDYKFAVEAVDVLRRVGAVIARYLLRAYDGELSAFIFALRGWANSNRPEELPSAQMLEEFIVERFGPKHHLTSLFRFALCSHNTLPHHDLPTTATSGLFDPEESYQLASHVHVLAELHDCQRLIDRIKQDTDRRCLLDESETGARATYLVSFTREGRVCYQIDPGLEAMLTLFTAPRSCREVTEFIREISGVYQLDSSYFEPLVDAGVLVPHATP